MFSDIYDELDKKVRTILSNTKEPSDTSEICDLVHTESTSLETYAKILFTTNNTFTQLNELFYKKFKNISSKPKNKTLNHIAPIYLSNYCVDACKYCDFSNTSKLSRTRLSIDEFETELEEVISQGNKVIELTLSSDINFSAVKLGEYISKAESSLQGEIGSGVLLCSNYFSKEEYDELKRAGLWGVVQWDETLDEKQFHNLHQGSKYKSNFRERINTHDKAMQAGLEVSTGCLFGLSDFKYDVLMQIAKARYLQLEYGFKPRMFGTPRIKNSSFNLVTNQQYELALMTYKLAEPLIGRWLQTRETHELNMRNVLGGDFYTYNCGNVKPGGYKLHKNNNQIKAQFKVNELDKKDFESRMNERGFEMNYFWILD